MLDEKNIAYIALGSNLGIREDNLNKAIELISSNSHNNFLKKSKWYENPAIEEAGPDDFLNGVIKVETSMQPQALLKFLQEVENTLDPDRATRGRKKARYIDLDILKIGDLVVNEPGLELPHPRMQERSFVMQPLRELEASDYADEIISKASENEVHVPPPFYGDENIALRTQVEKSIEELINSNKKFEIRKMYLSDIDEIYEMDAKCFGEKHWSREIFVKELSNTNALYLVAEEKNPKAIKKKLLGFIGVWMILDEMHIMTLGTEPEHRGQKIAEHLLLASLDSCLRSGVRTVTLEVRLSNIAAQKLYEKYGFQHQGIRKNYYNDDGESALILWTESIQEDKFLNLILENITKLAENLKK